MADEYRMALSELLRKVQMEGDVDFLREGVRVLAQAVMELEVSQQIGAERYERTSERTNQRNGYRGRPWGTRVGTIELKVPKVREGSFYPSLLDPRKRDEARLRRRRLRSGRWWPWCRKRTSRGCRLGG